METRVQMFLDGFQIHVYNKVGTYDRLDKLFGGVVDLSEPVQETQNTRNRWLVLFPYESIISRYYYSDVCFE